MACKPLALIITGILLTPNFASADVDISKSESDQAAEKAAKELANPNTAYASLNLKLQYSSIPVVSMVEEMLSRPYCSRHCHSPWIMVTK